ncbi:ornithine cyclodeaminase family protein [Fundidesulfovibrio butyratiphilus]
MRTLDAEATRRLLPFGSLADSIAHTLAQKAGGGVSAPSRLALPLPGEGLLLLMPASDGELAVVKSISVCPDNAKRGLPLIVGEVTAMRAETGERLAVLDGPAVTSRRTAAASLLAARLLAPKPWGSMLVVGCGVQALAHVRAFTEELAVEEVFVCGRTRVGAEAFVQRLGDEGVGAVTVRNPVEVIRKVNLVVTATTSKIPVLPETVPDGVFVAAVGSFSPKRAEVPAEVVREARVFVDDLESAREEAGDLLLAGIDWETVTPLEDVLSGDRPDGGPVLYKSVGHASLDLAAARLALGMA